MNIQISIDEDIYKKFQAALILTGEKEDVVLSNLISKYAHETFKKAMSKTSDSNDSNVNEKEQRQLFTNWFRSLTKNGKPYNLVTISGYAGRLEHACSNPLFDSIPVNNLFTVTDFDEFIALQKQIKECSGYSEFDAKSHNGFTAALKKYEEFLRFQSTDISVSDINSTSQTSSYNSNNHHWTLEEDTICCKKFLEYYVIKKSNIDTTQLVQILLKDIPDISEGSLQMKLQNIKYLSESYGLNDTAHLKGLSQYSEQCKKVFEQMLTELNT